MSFTAQGVQCLVIVTLLRSFTSALDMRRTTDSPPMSFRQRAKDRDALQKWMDGVLASAGKESGSKAMDAVVSQHKRRAECFAELQRQASVYSRELSQLLGKVWFGEERMMERLIASWMRLHAESEEREAEKNALVDKSKKQLEEMNFAMDELKHGLDASQATLCERLSDIETLRQVNSSLETEVARLRHLIGRYIQGHVVESDAEVELRLRSEKIHLMTELSPSGEPYSLAEIDRLARNRQRTVFETNDEIDIVIAELEKETERQRHCVKDIEAWARTENLSAAWSPLTMVDAACQCTLIRWQPLETSASHRRQPPPVLCTKSCRSWLDSSRGSNIPLLLRRQMSLFPKTRRVPSLRTTMRTILEVQYAKIEYDLRCEKAGRPKLALGAYPYWHFLRKYGCRELAEEHSTQLVLAIEHHADAHKRVRLFGEWIGVFDKATERYSAIRDSNLISNLFSGLKRVNEFTASIIADHGEARVDISRKKAADVALSILADALQDGGAELFTRVQALPPSATDGRCLDLDDFVEVVAAAWADVTILWKSHAAFLVSRYRVLFAVNEEMQFADDDGTVDRDVLLVRIDRPNNYKLREARNPTKKLVESLDRIAVDDSLRDEGTPPELVALLTDDSFDRIMRQVNPEVTNDEIHRLFERGKDVMTLRIQHALLSSWQRCYLDDQGTPQPYELGSLGVARPPSTLKREHPSPIDENGSPILITANEENDDLPSLCDSMDLYKHASSRQAPVDKSRIFWYSADLGRSQWTPPFDPTNFQVQEIDADVFCDLFLDEHIFARSPFTRLLGKVRFVQFSLCLTIMTLVLRPLAICGRTRMLTSRRLRVTAHSTQLRGISTADSSPYSLELPVLAR